MTEAWIIDAVRTPRGIGKSDGALAGIHPQKLFSQLLIALANRNSFDKADLDDVIAGVNTQQGKQALNLARMAVLDADFPHTVPGFSLDRFCGSGLTALNLAAMGVMSGLQNAVIAGGCEQMSHTRTLQRGFMMDSGNLALRKRIPQPHQGICADLIATLDGFHRDELDALALASQQRAARAIDEGRFAKSLVPVVAEDGTVLLDHEQFPRPQTTAESLANLKPAFATMMDRVVDEEGNSFGSLIRKS